MLSKSCTAVCNAVIKAQFYEVNMLRLRFYRACQNTQHTTRDTRMSSRPYGWGRRQDTGPPFMGGPFDGPVRDTDMGPSAFGADNGFNPRVHSFSSNPVPDSVNCGELRVQHEGKYIRLHGRTTRHKRGRFVQVKDSYGSTQLVVPTERAEILTLLNELPFDSNVEITGYVLKRPHNSINNNSPTGAIEVRVDEVLNYQPNLNGTKRFGITLTAARLEPKTVTNDEFQKCATSAIIKRFERRTITCDDLRLMDAGTNVTLVGWVDDVKFGKFLKLRDGYGMTQVVIPLSTEVNNITQTIASLKSDSIVQVKGQVRPRPPMQVNAKLNTGDIEVCVNDFTIIDPNIPIEDVDLEYSAPKKLSLTTEELDKLTTTPLLNRFKSRKHTCGGLNFLDAGKKITVVGWVDTLKLGKFLHVRDGYGCVQVVALKSIDELLTKFQTAKQGDFVEVVGTVTARPPGQINHRWETGEVEISASSLKIIDINEDFALVEAVEEIRVPPMHINSPVNKAESSTFTTRSYTCGELDTSHVGETVTLSGWLEYQRMKKFLTLRDGYGSTQIILPEDKPAIAEILDQLSYESILEVKGEVRLRPASMVNGKLSTGEIEVMLDQLKILNRVNKKLPFDIRSFNKAKEPLRMQHRYLDLRFAEMQHNLRLRSTMLMQMRDFLINHHNFVDVETPTLFRRTPGGAQEFVVPTRNSGEFYSLVQSPQQFKQMLMVGAIDRYFQIARCYRDEGARPDRQPEFTQLDIEMSFPKSDALLDLVEGLLVHSWPADKVKIETPFRRITYEQAMDRFGTDQPDMRFGIELQNITDVLKQNPQIVQCPDFAAYALCADPPYAMLPHQIISELKDIAQNRYPNVTFIQSRITEKKIGDWCTGKLQATLGENVLSTLVNKLNLDTHSVVFIAYGKKSDTQSLLGRIRLQYKAMLESRNVIVPVTPTEWNFVWVTDFPLFTQEENPDVTDDISLTATHHPFTAPHPDDVENLENNPLQVRSLAYDLVLNGNEIAGGSIRIHDPDLQTFVLEKCLKIEHGHLKHLIDALGSGCPPHGGIALGIDRLMAKICKVNSIRDVIAFPKGVDGRDPLSGAPCPISEHEKEMYHISVVPGDKSVMDVDSIGSLKPNNEDSDACVVAKKSKK